MIRNTVIALGLSVGLTAQLQAQPADPAAGWRGAKVMPKAGCVVKIGNKVVDQSKLTIPWIVQDVNGEWLWVGDHAKGWVNRSQVVTLGDATGYYTRLINRNPCYAASYMYRGVAWAEKDELELAFADFERYLRLRPNAVVYSARGAAWIYKNEYLKAIADFNESIRLDPNHGRTYSNCGYAWAATNEYDKAIADYNEAIRLDPSFAFAYECRGNAWLQKTEIDKAIADFDQAVRLDPNSACSYEYRGYAWIQKEDYDKAIADYNQALRLDPRHPSTYKSAALLRATCTDARCRNGQRAVELATRACELSGWAVADYLVVLAAAYAEAGDFESAIKYQNKAIELAPNDPDNRDYLTLFQDHKPLRR